MPFENTLEGNPNHFTKKQHFHLKSIIRKFSSPSNKVKIITKDGSTLLKSPDFRFFIGNRVWSQELESSISHPIENKFQNQVRRIELGQEIDDHKAISQYHLLWYLRWYYVTNEVDDFDLLSDMPCGDLGKEFE